MAQSKSDDLLGSPLPELSWDSKNALSSVRTLYREVERRALDTIAWYVGRKTPRARASKTFRAFAILLALVGTLMPLLDGVNAQLRWTQLSFGPWGYVAFALAAGLVLMDRFFGISSSWMRFASSALVLETSLRQFQLDWMSMEARGAGAVPSPEQLQQLLKRIRDFSIQMDATILKETQAWISEFRRNLAELEKLARAQAEAQGPGAVEVIVPNAPETDDGVTVMLDGVVVAQNVKDARCPPTHASAGQHAVTVRGQVDGIEKEATATTFVPAGGTGAVTVSLPR